MRECPVSCEQRDNDEMKFGVNLFGTSNQRIIFFYPALFDCVSFLSYSNERNEILFTLIENSWQTDELDGSLRADVHMFTFSYICILYFSAHTKFEGESIVFGPEIVHRPLYVVTLRSCQRKPSEFERDRSSRSRQAPQIRFSQTEYCIIYSVYIGYVCSKIRSELPNRMRFLITNLGSIIAPFLLSVRSIKNLVWKDYSFLLTLALFIMRSNGKIVISSQRDSTNVRGRGWN